MTGLNVPGQSMPLGGGLAAPVRSPIGQSRPMTALGAAAAQKEVSSTPLGSRTLGQSAPLAPARAPIGGTAAPLGAPQVGTPGFLGTKSVIKPIQPNESESTEEENDTQEDTTETEEESTSSSVVVAQTNVRSTNPKSNIKIGFSEGFKRMAQRGILIGGVLLVGYGGLKFEERTNFFSKMFKGKKNTAKTNDTQKSTEVNA